MTPVGAGSWHRRDRATAQRLFDRWARAFSERDVGALASLSDPELVLRPLTTLRLPGDPYRGHEGLREWIAETSYRFKRVTMAGRVVEATQCSRSRSASTTRCSS